MTEIREGAYVENGGGDVGGVGVGRESVDRVADDGAGGSGGGGGGGVAGAGDGVSAGDIGGGAPVPQRLLNSGDLQPGIRIGNKRVYTPEEAHLAYQTAGRTKIRLAGGRPTKCTIELLEQLAKFIQGGIHPNDACGMVGISKKARIRWTEKGRLRLAENPHARSIYAEFVRVCEGQGAIARGVIGAKLHKMARDGNIAAAQSWMKYFGVPAFQPPVVALDPDQTGDATVTIEFDGAQVFGQSTLKDDDDDAQSPE